jgi:hypothetical protein
MLGIRLFWHAVQMVVNNWQAALRIALFPVLLSVMATIVLNVVTGADLMSLWAGYIGMDGMEGPVMLASFASFIIYGVICIWITVYWHRYILLEELPNSFVYWADWGTIWAYLLWAFLLALMVAIPLMIPGIILTIALTMMFGGYELATEVIIIVFLFVLTIITLRVSIVLPALAIRRKMSVREGWKAGAGHMPAFALIAFIEILIGYATEVVPSYLGAGVPLLGFLLSTVLNISLLIVSVSVLTTIYGHFVEERPLG